ncbi:class F sortase [Nocardioides houyundeii]|uniref:class F sortase n=1 Tax=Nocardioides houyundeii TaxID=2045452 RepID=UPI000DF35313|nr:class F sortase [Nocardioides houyundeii]
MTRRATISLSVLAAVLVLGGLLTRDPEARPPETSPPVASAPVDAVPDAIPAAVSAPSVPVSLTIPSIGASSDLVGLGMERDRTVEVPRDADQAGWYELGTSPGQPGSAVILGHVDSTRGPAVFHRLRELVPGAHVRVVLADGAVETFAVSRLETVRNDDFPAQRVYAGTPDRPTLTLVTCGGEYDAARGGYQANVIAYAEHLSTDRSLTPR